MINTNCSQCIFSNPVNSDVTCRFNIPSSLKDQKKITEKEGYNYIENYQCKYCFSKDILNSNKHVLEGMDLEEEIKTRNLIKYSLVVDLKDYTTTQFAIQQINSFQIFPKYLLMLFYSDKMKENIEIIKKNLNEKIKWKAHNFLDGDINHNQALKTGTDTNKDISTCPFLWIVKAESLQRLNQTNAIGKINYIVNVEQPVCNFIRSSINTENNFHNMFMNYGTYHHITKNIKPSLEEGIATLENTTTIYYD